MRPHFFVASNGRIKVKISRLKIGQYIGLRKFHNLHGRGNDPY